MSLPVFFWRSALQRGLKNIAVALTATRLYRAHRQTIAVGTSGGTLKEFPIQTNKKGTCTNADPLFVSSLSEVTDVLCPKAIGALIAKSMPGPTTGPIHHLSH